ncbi:MAG: response regulator, partial [Gemmatimonadota bacterium]
MSAGPLIVYHSAHDAAPPEPLTAFVRAYGYRLKSVDDREEVLATVNRTHPGLVVLDARADLGGMLDLCDTIKRDPFTAIVPVLIWDKSPNLEAVNRAFEAGADEFVSAAMTDDEQRLRIGTIIRRAERDVSVHPTTRLPGTVQIERDISTRLESEEQFAVCYAD